MKNIELVQCLRRLRRNSASLASVEVNFLGFSPAECSNHAAFLKTQNLVTSVYLSQGRIGRMGVQAVFRVLASNPAVHKVSLTNVPTGSEEEILVAILQDSHLKSLEVRDVRQECMISLTNALKYSHTLTQLSIVSVPDQIGSGAAQAFMDVLTCHPSVRSFSFKGVNEEVVLAIATALELHDSQLTSLCLDNCILDPQVTVAVAWALRFNTSLTRLDLLHNMVGATGASSFAAALRTNRTLKTFTLRDCRLGNEQATKSLAFMIENNSTLSELDLEQNWIDVDGTITIANSLKMNSSLIKLHYRGNSPMIAGILAIAQAVQDNASLQSVDIGGTWMWENQVSSISTDTPLGFRELIYGLELNRAGRRLIRRPNLPLPQFVSLLAHSINQTHLLYGLLREVPHQWCS